MAQEAKSSPFRLVFSYKANIALAAGIAGIFWIILNSIDQLLFFWPVVTFYLPTEKLLGFVLSSMIAVMMGIVISMNVFAYRTSKKLSGSLFSGSTLGIASCACAGCSTIGLSVVSSMGGIGAAALAFFIVFQIPLRIASLCILGWTYFSIHRSLARH